MGKDFSLSREAFLHLAAEAGLDVHSPHMDDLYPYVENILAGLRALHNLDVGDAEPDMAFLPMRQGSKP